MSAGIALLRKFLTEGLPLSLLLESGVTRESFSGGERVVYDMVTAYIAEFGTCPQLETVTAETGVQFPDFPDEPIEYWISKVWRRCQSQSVADAAVELTSLAADGEIVKARDVARGLYRSLDSKSISDKIHGLLDGAEEAMQAHDRRQRSPGLQGVPFGLEYLDIVSDGAQGSDTVAVVGRPGVGKAQPLDAKIHTPGGWEQMGNMKVGTVITSVDGDKSTVTSIHPQGMREVYRITFSDGRSTECDGRHLWKVRYRDWYEERVITTLQIRELLYRKRYKKRLSIPLCRGSGAGVHGCNRLHPWLLGFLIGDGSLTQQVGFSTADYEMVKKVAKCLPFGYIPIYRSQYDYNIVSTGDGSPPNDIKQALVELGVWGTKAEAKFIPESYMNAEHADRVQLLQGLMDSDGTVGRRKAASFSSSSKTLASQVAELIRSLGGIAKVSMKNTSHLPSYRVGVKLQNLDEIFSLGRKKERCHGPYTISGKPTALRLSIKSVEYIGRKKCQCISVSHPSKLYVTDDHIVTHNTYFCLSMANCGFDAGEVPLVVSMEMSVKQCARRIMALRTGVPAAMIRLGRLSYFGRDRLITDISGLRQIVEDRPFHLMQGSLASSVEDLAMRVQELRPTVLYVDGAYLLRTNEAHDSRWERVTYTAEYLKMIATEFDIPVIGTYQFNRRGPGSLGNVAFSDSIGMLASIVIGIADESSEDMSNWSPVSYKIVELLKGREGERGVIRVIYDMARMRIRQDRVLKGAGMQALANEEGEDG